MKLFTAINLLKNLPVPGELPANLPNLDTKNLVDLARLGLVRVKTGIFMQAWILDPEMNKETMSYSWEVVHTTDVYPVTISSSSEYDAVIKSLKIECCSNGLSGFLPGKVKVDYSHDQSHYQLTESGFAFLQKAEYYAVTEPDCDELNVKEALATLESRPLVVEAAGGNKPGKRKTSPKKSRKFLPLSDVLKLDSMDLPIKRDVPKIWIIAGDVAATEKVSLRTYPNININNNRIISPTLSTQRRSAASRGGSTVFFPTDQDSTIAVKPTVGTFNDPTTRFFAGLLTDFFRLFAARTHVKRVPELVGDGRHFVADVSRVETQMLPVIRLNLWTRDRNTFQRRTRQFRIVTIRTIHRHPQRNPISVRQDATFRPAFSAVCRVRTGSFFHPPATPSSHRPSTANAI